MEPGGRRGSCPPPTCRQGGPSQDITNDVTTASNVAGTICWLIKISPVGEWRSTSLEWPWPWPWIRPYGIPSCITHRPLPTYEISLKSKKLFVDGRKDGHFSPSNIIRSTFGSRPKNEKKRSERRKHCALAVVRRSQKNSPHRRPPSRGEGRPKFNQLEMVTTFTYKPSLVRIDARNFELLWLQTHRQDRLQYTAPISLARSVTNVC